jgi:hypothetical protein
LPTITIPTIIPVNLYPGCEFCPRLAAFNPPDDSPIEEKLISNEELSKYMHIAAGLVGVKPKDICAAGTIGKRTITIRESFWGGSIQIGLGGRPSTEPYRYWWQDEGGWHYGPVKFPVPDIQITPR